jgi:hypothetical protein
MNVIKEEPDADTDMGPTLNEFELVHIKQEDSPVLFCSVKSEFKVGAVFVLHIRVKGNFRRLRDIEFNVCVLLLHQVYHYFH